MKRFQNGFTLIEVLVVVSILGVLAGLISILITTSQKRKEEFETKQAITMVRTAIDNYQQDFKRLPPETMAGFAGTQWAGLSISENTSNECCECLLVALHHPDLRTPLTELPGTKPFGNTDNDVWNKVPVGSETDDAREILDAWGNPIVYITKNHYDQPVQICLSDGTVIDVHAVKKDSGVYYNQDTFQLISLGRDGKQDEGVHNDDIENFTRDEE
jgi:prepilin-type N-terminal cleavage/methylation domain-containing protein